MKNNLKNLTITAMLFALGMVLPFFTGQIPQIGGMLLPMHLPVFLCALICGWQYGLPMAFLVPLLRSMFFGMPPVYPTALAMAFELAAYAFVSGYLYENSKWQCVKALYKCLCVSMIIGRIVWGIAQILLLSISGTAFTFQAFITGALLNAVPGIALQLMLIPAVMAALNRAKVVPFKHEIKQTAGSMAN